MGKRIVGTIAMLAALAVGSPATAGATTPPPPGANDFTCKPTATKPYPVVLLHGTFGNMFDSFQFISPGLKAQGYCVFALNYGGQPPASTAGIYGTAEISGSARQLDAFVARVRSATGAAKVSLVGHSQGGMMPRYYLKFLGGTGEVDDLVGLAPSNHGTTNPLAGPAGVFCRACTQQIAGSAFLRNLNAGDETPGAVSYTQVVTRYDEVVIPHTSGFLAPGANTTNVRLQDRCPADFTEHLGIIYDPVAFQWVSNALARRGPADPAFRPVC
jgi:triacylglycerol lipase